MKAEAFYLLAMLDYLSKRNGLPKCNEYEEIRRYKLEKPVFPADTELSEKLLGKIVSKYGFRPSTTDIDDNYPKLLNEGNLASVLEAAKRKRVRESKE